MCIAPTGSGKTLAYVLPTIVNLGDPARNLRGKVEGRGVRAIVVVPTHDLAAQIYAVIRAVTTGRSWRCLILTKATEKAVCESCSGSDQGTNEGDTEGVSDATEEEGGRDGDYDEGNPGEEDQTAIFTATGGSVPLGIDILIATPERLHHLLETGRLSLSMYVSLSLCMSRLSYIQDATSDSR